MKMLITCILALGLVTADACAQEMIKAWEFNTDGDAEGWGPTHSLAPFTVRGGTLRTEVTGGDPYMHTMSLRADITCNDFQYIELRMKLDGRGTGAEFFWASVVGGARRGFVAGEERSFQCIPDGQWHTYFVYPLWRDKVWGLRLDLPEGDGTAVELDYIRIWQGQRVEHDPRSPAWDFTQSSGAWLAVSGGTHLTGGAAGAETTLLTGAVTLISPVLDLQTTDYRVACLELYSTGKLAGGLYWADESDGSFPGCNAVQFDVPGGPFVTTLQLAGSPMWTGALKRLSLRLGGEPGTQVTLKSLVLAEKPVGPGRLQIISFASEEALATLGQAGRLIARVENAGGTPLKDVALTVETAPARASVAPATQQVAELAPGVATNVTWTFTPAAEGRTAFALTGPDGQRQETEVVVAPAFPRPADPGRLAAEVEPDAAWIGNNKVLLTLIRNQAGFAHARLDAVDDGGARPMAVLPHLASLYLEHASAAVDLAFQEATVQQVDGQVVLQLAGTTETDAATVTASLTLTLQQEKSYIDTVYTLRADRPLRIAAFRGPWLWAGEGAFGAQQDLALFPGSEYMESGERSSSTLDIAAPMNIRFAPHPNTVTVPSMAVEKDGGIVGLMWDPLQKWDGQHDRPTAVFASPNFIEGHANHLLGLCLPSIPDYLAPNTLLAHTAYDLQPGAQLTLAAAVYAESKSDVLRSIDLYLERYGVPDLPPKPRSYEDTVAMSLKSYDSVLWNAEKQGWHSVLQWAPDANPDVALRYYVLASRLLSDPAFARRLDEKGRAMVNPAELGTTLHLGGAPCGALREMLAAARIEAARVPADGKYGFVPRETTRMLGVAGTAESGICAQAIRGTLQKALHTGDPSALDAALRTLGFMERFQIPRASQIWECPVHSPDILAAGDCCEVYLLAYRITKDPEMLQRAVYWAKTGLPFVYMWQAPEHPPLMKGSSIAIFGATYYVGSWFARPVQWNGLAYAGALLELAKYDHTLPWKHFAEMITISGMNQQSTRAHDFGCYADNWDVIDDVESVGCMLAPGGILKNVLEILEAPTGVQTEVVTTADGRRLVINAAPRITDATVVDGALQLSLRYFPGATARTAIMPIAEPTRIEVDGKELAKQPALEVAAEGVAAEGWSYAADIGCLTIQLQFGQTPRAVRIAEALPIVPGAGTYAWEFNGSDGAAEGWQAAHDVAPLTANNGSLHVSVTGADPYIHSPAVFADAAAHRGIVFRAKATCRGGQLFFSNEEGGFAPIRSVAFDLPADGQFHEVTLDLSRHAQWKGLITRLRLDFAAAPCDVELDWVRFLGAGRAR